GWLQSAIERFGELTPDDLGSGGNSNGGITPALRSVRVCGPDLADCRGRAGAAAGGSDCDFASASRNAAAFHGGARTGRHDGRLVGHPGHPSVRCSHNVHHPGAGDARRPSAGGSFGFPVELALAGLRGPADWRRGGAHRVRPLHRTQVPRALSQLLFSPGAGRDRRHDTAHVPRPLEHGPAGDHRARRARAGQGRRLPAGLQRPYRSRAHRGGGQLRRGPGRPAGKPAQHHDRRCRETLYGIDMTYMHYFLLCAPVLGIVKAFLVWRLLIRMHPAPTPCSDEDGSKADQLSPEAKRVGILLALAILLWATDFWHGFKPGWVALLVGVLCITPGIGVLPVREIVNPLRLLIIIWVGTVLSLASVMTESGASTLISSALARLAGVEGQGPAYGYFAMAYLSSLVSVLATFGGAVPIMATVAAEISNATGLPLETAVMAIAPGMSAMFFPYMASPFVVGLAMGHVSHRAALPFMVTLALVTCAIIIPLNAFWWWLLEFLP